MVVGTEGRLSDDDSSVMLQVEGRIYPVARRGGQQLPPRINRQTTDLSLSGRRPLPSRGKASRQAAARKKAIAEQMAIRIWERLPLASKSIDDFKTSPEIVRCFNESHNQLVERAAEARRLLEKVCRAHVRSVRDDRIEEERQREAEEAKVRECTDVTMPAAWLGPELDAATVAKEPPVVMARLTKSLATSVFDMVESFFSAMEQLVDKEVFGLIEWHSDSVCKFHFFRRLLIHQFDGQTTERTEELWDAIDDWGGSRVTTTTTTAKKGRHIHEQIRHEQQLMEAAKRPLAAPDLVIPEDVQEIVDAIPEWLAPFVRVAVGECFRERIIRHTEKTEEWSQVIERAVTYFDPAITIGEFVLTGWGQREDAAEMERRSRVRRAEMSRRKAKDTGLLAALMFAVGTLLLLVSLVFATKLVWPSVAVCLASLVPLNLAVVHNGRWRDVKLSAETFFLVNMSGVLLTLVTVAAMLAVVEKRLILAATGVVVLCFFIPMFRAAIGRLRPRTSTAEKAER